MFFFLTTDRSLLLGKIKCRKKNLEGQCWLGTSFVTIGHSLLQTVDRPKDWYKTMFKQIHMVHKPGMCAVLFLIGPSQLKEGIYAPFHRVPVDTKRWDPSDSMAVPLFNIPPCLPSIILKSQTPVLLFHPWAAQKLLTRWPLKGARCSGPFLPQLLIRREQR